jgi:hypothetical protein
MPYDAVMRWEWEGGALPPEARVRPLARREQDEERGSDIGDGGRRGERAREAGAARDDAAEEGHG